MQPITIISYTSQYAEEISKLYHASVHAITPEIYTKEQQEAWAPTPPDYTMWYERLQKTQPYLAMLESKIVGFIELENDGHIDCAYTHPEHQKSGIMTKLYEHIEWLAYEKKLQRLYVEASFLIQPFFEKRGFKIIQENKVLRNDCILTNYSMEKILTKLV